MVTGRESLGVGGLSRVIVAPLQMVDPVALFESSRAVRGSVAFVLVLCIGGVLLSRFGGLVDRSIDASIDRPLSSMGYGVAAHAVLGLVGFYLASQLALVVVSGRPLAALGIVFGLLSLLVAGALGFTVVGSALVELGWERRRWHGLVVGAALAGIAVSVDLIIGGIVWVVVVSTGIGGPVRRWVHASEDRVPKD